MSDRMIPEQLDTLICIEDYYEKLTYGNYKLNILFKKGKQYIAYELRGIVYVLNEQSLFVQFNLLTSKELSDYNRHFTVLSTHRETLIDSIITNNIEKDETVKESEPQASCRASEPLNSLNPPRD
jgi:hypothetical protein